MYALNVEGVEMKRRMSCLLDDKFIRRKGGTLARRGTAGAQRAEKREGARKRAQAAATKRRQAKNK